MAKQHYFLSALLLCNALAHASLDGQMNLSKEVWQKKKEAIANHYLDAEVYAVAAADIIRALNIRREEGAKQRVVDDQLNAKQIWIRKREGSWL